MRSRYLQERLRDAVEALAPTDGDLRERLYAAYLQLHTILPEHLPEGTLRRRFASIHDRFTKRNPADREETGAIDVIRHLDIGTAATLAQDIRALELDLAEQLAERPQAPTSAAPVDALRAAPPAARDRPLARLLVVFATTEGHTRRIAGFVARELTAAGCDVTSCEAAEARTLAEPESHDGVLVAASLHWGRYQSSIADYVSRRQEALNARPSGFISVSLAAGGVKAAEPPWVADCVHALREETGWIPETVHHVGGCIRHSGYDYYRRLAAGLIAAGHGEEVNLSADYDLTDYPALRTFVLAFAGRAPADPDVAADVRSASGASWAAAPPGASSGSPSVSK